MEESKAQLGCITVSIYLSSELSATLPFFFRSGLGQQMNLTSTGFSQIRSLFNIYPQDERAGMFLITLFLWLAPAKGNRGIARFNHMQALSSLPVDGVRMNFLVALSRVHLSELHSQIIEITSFA